LTLCVFVSFDDEEKKDQESKEDELSGVPLYINMSENPKKAKWVLAFGKLNQLGLMKN
jgi:hypothetical protein